jgi:hypothetical protein
MAGAEVDAESGSEIVTCLRDIDLRPEGRGSASRMLDLDAGCGLIVSKYLLIVSIALSRSSCVRMGVLTISLNAGTTDRSNPPLDREDFRSSDMSTDLSRLGFNGEDLQQKNRNTR